MQLHITRSEIAKEDGKTNLADILTKPLSGPRMKDLLYHILY